MVKINFGAPEKSEEAVKQPQDLQLTERAAKRILEIMHKKGEEGLSLRLSVLGGGCSGYSYNFKLTSDKSPSDITIQNDAIDGAEVVIDVMSFGYLKGSTIDFEETLEASQFTVNNPNATASCGCGSSFSL